MSNYPMPTPNNTVKVDPATMPSVVVPARKGNTPAPAAPYNEPKTSGWRTETKV
jgi:hypothetical protein